MSFGSYANVWIEFLLSFLLTLRDPFEFVLMLLIAFSLIVVLVFPDAIVNFYSVVTLKKLFIWLFCSHLLFLVQFHLKM